MAVLASGCGGTDLVSRLDDYQARVAQTLGVDPDSVGVPRAHLRLPSRRERRIDVEDKTIGGFDFLAIQGCRLSQLVGHRNSPLGRTMVPSQRLIYELQVLAAADACLAGLSSERAARLGTLMERKRAELPSHVWNAIWSGEELEAYLSAQPQPLAAMASLDQREGLVATANALTEPILRPEEGEALERSLILLRDEHPAGATLLRIDRVRRRLEVVADLLEARAPQPCRGDEVRLATIFESSYLPLQREIAALDRRARERVEALGAIFDASAARLAAPPEPMVAYAEAVLDPERRDGAWQRYRSALRRHTLAWEPTLTACGRLPGPEAS